MSSFIISYWFKYVKLGYYNGFACSQNCRELIISGQQKGSYFSGSSSNSSICEFCFVIMKCLSILYEIYCFFGVFLLEYIGAWLFVLTNLAGFALFYMWFDVVFCQNSEYKL